eukprot:gene25303-biopygen15020
MANVDTWKRKCPNTMYAISRRHRRPTTKTTTTTPTRHPSQAWLLLLQHSVEKANPNTIVWPGGTVLCPMMPDDARRQPRLTQPSNSSLSDMSLSSSAASAAPWRQGRDHFRLAWRTQLGNPCAWKSHGLFLESSLHPVSSRTAAKPPMSAYPAGCRRAGCASGPHRCPAQGLFWHGLLQAATIRGGPKAMGFTWGGGHSEHWCGNKLDARCFCATIFPEQSCTKKGSNRGNV